MTAAAVSARTADLAPVYMRNASDCLRAAMATLAGVCWEDACDADLGPESFDAWQRWSARRGLKLTTWPPDALPVDRDRWVCFVGVPAPPDGRQATSIDGINRHTVVMCRDRLIHDPLPYRDREHDRLLSAAEPRLGVTLDPLDPVDEFGKAAGVLSGKSLPIGGAWSGVGDADDFETTGPPFFRAVRSVTSDADYDTGRYARAGAGTLTAVAVQGTMYRTGGANEGDVLMGVFARYVDVNNWLMAQIFPRWGPVYPGMARIVKRVGGTVEMLAGIGDSGLGMLPPDTATSQGRLSMPLAPNVTYTIQLVADSAGRVFMTVAQKGAITPGIQLSASDDDLATGGPLENGGYGIYSANPNTLTAFTVVVESFAVSVSPVDAAVFAGQSLELRHDRAIRQSADGDQWATVAIRRGRYLRIPPAGREGGSTRFVVQPYINDVDTMVQTTNPGVIQARLFATPRGLVVPKS